MTMRHKNHRRSIRLKGYDYTRAGAYFVSICTKDRACLFGDVADGVMRLNQMGHIVRQCWLAIPDHFPHVLLDEFVVMPNHVHGILVIMPTHDVGATHASPLQNDDTPTRPRGPQPRSVASIVGSFSSNPPPPNASTNIAAPPARRSGNAITTNISSVTTNP